MKLATLAALRCAQGPSRYAGVLAAAAKWRAAIVPQPPSDHDAETVQPSPAPAATPPSPPTHRSKYRPNATLPRHPFAIDLETCDHCGGRTKVIARVRDPDGIARFLRHLGEPSEPPPLPPPEPRPSPAGQVKAGPSTSVTTAGLVRLEPSGWAVL